MSASHSFDREREFFGIFRPFIFFGRQRPPTWSKWQPRYPPPLSYPLSPTPPPHHGLLDTAGVCRRWWGCVACVLLLLLFVSVLAAAPWPPPHPRPSKYGGAEKDKGVEGASRGRTLRGRSLRGPWGFVCWCFYDVLVQAARLQVTPNAKPGVVPPKEKLVFGRTFTDHMLKVSRMPRPLVVAFLAAVVFARTAVRVEQGRRLGSPVHRALRQPLPGPVVHRLPLCH